MNYDLYSISDFTANLGEGMTSENLSGFRCSKDVDRESFLHDKALGSSSFRITCAWSIALPDSCTRSVVGSEKV